MAVRVSNPINRLLEYIVIKPLRATVVVGGAILLLQFLIHHFGVEMPELLVLQYIVPFIPPFFITLTANRINRRRVEHGFIRDAEPYIFIAFPEEATVESLLSSKPCMLSDQTACHLNQSIETLLEQLVLAPEQLHNPKDRVQIVDRLVSDLNQGDRNLGSITDFPIELIPKDSPHPCRYLMNSVLKKEQGRIKWQGTLMRYRPWRE
jgi:hypothetical protein